MARRISLAIALVASLVVFALAASDALGVWARRNLLFSDELWPRKTHLLVEGFDSQGHIKIARGSDWPLLVKADAALGRSIPEIVEVRYSTTEGARGRENMSREGVVTPGQSPYQNYSHTFKSVLAPLEFYVFGGDDRQGPYYLDVVDSPTISRMTLALRVSGVHAPRAARRARGRADAVAARHADHDPRRSQQAVGVGADRRRGRREHAGDAPIGRGSGARARLKTAFSSIWLDSTPIRRCCSRLRDADGIRSREAVRLALAAVPDEPPQVNVQLKGIGTAITSHGPVAGRRRSLRRLWHDQDLVRLSRRRRAGAAEAVQRPRSKGRKS